jgi:hypothetical protein
MLRLDYISCLLTVVSTILVGRRLWQGWIVAGANSVIICMIGLKTAQIGFIPANVFCLGLYGYNLVNWRSHRQVRGASAASDTQMPAHSRIFRESPHQVRGAIENERFIRPSHRIRPRRLRS